MFPSTSRYRSEWLAAAALLAATLAAFARVLQNDFVNFDDPAYVLNSFDVQAGLTFDSVLWALTAFRASNWHPLTWLSLQLDYELFGLAAWAYHLHSLLLHAAGTLLLFLVLRLATGAVWRSAVVAALFALHPLHVESVAWVSERKDVLSGVFFMLTLLAYLDWLRRPGRRRYALVVLAFALGLLAKPMLVTLPFVLLLLDCWPLRRAAPAWRLLWEKTPLFVLAACSCGMTWWAQHEGGAVRSLDRLPLWPRVANALVAYVTYLGKAVWPSDLAAYYPHPGTDLPLWQPAAAGVFLAGVTVLAVLLRRRAPYLLVGWLWYLGMLVPVIGLVQVGRQALADRYTYLPLIGIFLAVVWLAADVVPAGWRRPVLVPAAVLVLLPCAVLTWRQVGFWHDSITLWEHTLALTENNCLAHNNLASAFEDAGRFDEALAEFAAAARACPGEPRMQVTLGRAYQRRGRLPEALVCFRKAVDLAPANPDYRFRLAEALQAVGDSAAAAREESEGDRLWRQRDR